MIQFTLVMFPPGKLRRICSGNFNPTYFRMMSVLWSRLCYNWPLFFLVSCSPVCASDLKIISARLHTGSPSDDFFLTGSSAAKFVENNVENKENKERKKERNGNKIKQTKMEKIVRKEDWTRWSSNLVSDKNRSFKLELTLELQVC